MHGEQFTASTVVKKTGGFGYQKVIDSICALKWDTLDQEDLINVAWVYYYFSVQFREKS